MWDHDNELKRDVNRPDDLVVFQPNAEGTLWTEVIEKRDEDKALVATTKGIPYHVQKKKTA